MKPFLKWLSLAVLILLPAPLYAEPTIRHEMRIVIQPENHGLQVEDTITLPEAWVAAEGGRLQFLLHDGLEPTTPADGVKIVRLKETNPDHRNAPTFDDAIRPARYELTLSPGKFAFVVRYQGRIDHPLKPEREVYARSFSETPGLIASEGIVLSGSTQWYPWFNDDPVVFSMDLRLPEPWEAVSQGERSRHERKNGIVEIRWESPEPQDEIYLVGGRWTEVQRAANGLRVMAFLRTPDEKLADNYIEAAFQYLEMYGKLIGPYPYKKFALVENFWETGYGMPSFTLLGPSVIRLPFILHSSYPHEILHNWWGNGVYVDDSTGNWSEGLTAYLADHLVQEQRGAGADYRRATLQKYVDYVAAGKDFPPAEFRARSSPATEAIGYGKTLMFFHMLRLQLGDETFVRGLQKFYRENKFRRASFADLQSAFSSVAGRDLKNEFDLWINRTGAPSLSVGDAKAEALGKDYRLTAVIEQTQPGPDYRLRVPVAVSLEGREEAYQTTVMLDTKRLRLELTVPARPLRLDVDPEFDLFRRLDRNEIPPALSQMFGAEKVLIVIPYAATDPLREAYRKLAESLKQSPSDSIEIQSDNELNELPKDRGVWIFGWENRFRPQIDEAVTGYDVAINPAAFRIGRTEIAREGHSVVLTARRATNPALTIGWLAADHAAALPGLGRKLPHYGKYSYLGFEGHEPANVLKGEWPVIQSPMSVLVAQADGTAAQTSGSKRSARTALAALPSVFSEARMLQDVRRLSGDDLKGRGFGSHELDRAAEEIAARFREIGLKPGGDPEGSYFQVWNERGGNPEKETVLKNVIGILPGGRADWAGQSVVVGAHYDHLGLGWPDAHEGDRGKIHPGADDNASGVAVLLEVARVLSGGPSPERTVVFVAFSGEEASLRGSKHYVASAGRFPAGQIIGMLNLDTIGRLGKNKLMIFGTGSAREWTPIFMGAGFVTGAAIEPVANDYGSGDQQSFLDAGIPAVQFFSGPNLDYHRPTDTADKIDPAGMAKIAAVLKEAVEYLAARPEPLTVLLPSRGDATASVHAPPAQGRRVGLGTVPDFAYAGKGVRLTAVAPGSAADSAGLRAGDVIVRLNAVPVESLRAYSDFLKAVSPGEKISITFVREGKERTAEVIAVFR